MQRTIKERSYKYDNIKALLIFLVVLGHFLELYLQTGGLFVRAVYIFIYTFHMPVFLFTTGAFAKKNSEKSVLFLLLSAVFDAWYLFSITVYSLLIPFFPQNVSKKRKYITIIASCAVGIIAGFFHLIGKANDFHLSRTIVFFPFYLAGRYGIFQNENYSIQKSQSRRGVVRVLVTTLCGFVAIALSFVYIIWNKGNHIFLWQTRAYSTSHTAWYFRLLIYITAFCWIRFFIGMIPNIKIPVISSIGKHTLVIYLGHEIILKQIVHIVGNDCSMRIMIITSIVVTLALWGLSIGIKCATKKIKERITKTDANTSTI